MNDIGVAGVKARMHLHATAAQRNDPDALWILEQEARQRLPLPKVLEAERIADHMTKDLTASVIPGYSTKMKIIYASGRSDIAQQ